jgi:phosphonate transport system permease protein
LAVFGALAVISVLVSLYVSDFFSWSRWNEALPAIWHLGMESLPPDWSILDKLWKGALESIVMSIAGTFIAIAIALPLSFLAARNITPFPPLVILLRGFFNMLRSIPELILAILFVASVGFGILAGVLAVGLHSVGMLGKFFTDTIETVDQDLIEAVKSTGANRFQIIEYGVIPQVMSRFIDFSLYRWEYNFRASVIVGVVGAGGIGFQIMLALRLMQYQQLLVGLLSVLLLVAVVDGFGNAIRKKLTS